MGRSVEFVNSVDLLGVPLYADFKVNHIHRNVQKLYCKVNSVLLDFNDIPNELKSKLMDTYCLDLYGSQLWKYSKNDVNAFYIAWQKVVRRIWKIRILLIVTCYPPLISLCQLILNGKRVC